MIAVFLVLILVGTGFAVAFLSVDDSENGDEIEKNKYVQSIELGGEWFLNNQDESFLYYEYNFFGKNHSSSHHSLREMGALWSISMLDDFLDDDRYADLARKGFRHFQEHFVHDQENDFLYINITPTKIKLGYSAFIILSLLNMEHEQKDYYLTQFANGILFQQNPDGSFNTFFYSDETTGVDYYPGESLFALMSLYSYNGNSSYLEAAEKAFPFYTEYWRNDPNTAFIAWQTRAYYLLYQATGKREYADFVIEMNDYLLDEYDPGENCTGFEFSTSTVSVHSEGVIQAYKLAEQLDDMERWQCYKNFIQEGSDFMLTLQVTGTANIFELAAVGGFLQSEGSDSMRVDRNQHAVVALMEGYEVGILD